MVVFGYLHKIIFFAIIFSMNTFNTAILVKKCKPSSSEGVLHAV